MIRRRASVAALLLLAGCASQPSARSLHLWSFDGARIAALGAEQFPGAATVLSGFAPSDDDPAMRVGDTALLGVEITNGDTVDRMLLVLEVTSLLLDAAVKEGTGERIRPSFTATHTFQRWNPNTRSLGATETIKAEVHPVRVALIRLDANGQRQQVSEATLFEEPLVAGLWPHADRTASERDEALCSTLTRTLQDLANDDEVLQDLLFRIVEKPSLLSIARYLGVAVVLVWTTFAEPQLVQLPGVDTQVRRVSLEVNINTEAGLLVDLAVAKPNGATMTCGGLIGAIARHPNDASRFAVVRLLGTRRGPRVSG